MDTIPAQIYNDDNTNYWVFDGNGNIYDASMFCGITNGTYSVTSGGAVSGSLICDGYSFPFSAQLISQNYAPMGSGWALSRIMNPGALTDSLVGTLFTANCGQRNVTLRLNSLGQIVSSSGLTSPVQEEYMQTQDILRDILEPARPTVGMHLQLSEPMSVIH